MIPLLALHCSTELQGPEVDSQVQGLGQGQGQGPLLGLPAPKPGTSKRPKVDATSDDEVFYLEVHLLNL